MTTQCNGWDLGVKVRASVNDLGEDIFQVYRTAGSNGNSSELIATVSTADIILNNINAHYLLG